MEADMNVQVGEAVIFGADETGSPIWDLFWRRPVKFSGYSTGRVVKVDEQGFIVAFTPADGKEQRWRCAGVMPVGARDEWFFRGEDFLRITSELKLSVDPD